MKQAEAPSTKVTAEIGDKETEGTRTRTMGIKAMGRRTMEIRVMKTRATAVMTTVDRQQTGVDCATDAEPRDILLETARLTYQRPMDRRTASGIREVTPVVMEIPHPTVIGMAVSGMVTVVVTDEIVIVGGIEIVPGDPGTTGVHRQRSP